MKTRLCFFAALLLSVPVQAQTRDENSTTGKNEIWLQGAVKAAITPQTSAEAAAHKAALSAEQSKARARIQARLDAKKTRERKFDYLETAARFEPDLAYSDTCEFSRASYTYSCN